MYAWKSWKEVLELGRFIDFQNDEGTFSIDTSTIPFFRCHHCLQALPSRTHAPTVLNQRFVHAG
jgi:membrane protease subunit (stomatin/prohibitin family)